MPSPTQLLPVAELVQRARLYPAQALPTLTHQSYPVPVRHKSGGLRMLFFYCRAEVIEPRDGLKLWPPGYIAYLDAFTGKFEELKSVSPGDFGQHHSMDKPIGKYLTSPERTAAEFLNKLVLWYQAYDAILACFAAGISRPTNSEEQSVEAYTRLMPEVTEAPLLPYYHAAGHEFFDWMRRLTPVNR